MKTMFAKFLGHYAGEARLFSTVIASLATRFLEHDEQRALAEAAERFSKVAENIEETLSRVDEAVSVKITPKQIQDAVKKELPALISSAIAEARKAWDIEQAAKSPPV